MSSKKNFIAAKPLSIRVPSSPRQPHRARQSLVRERARLRWACNICVSLVVLVALVVFSAGSPAAAQGRKVRVGVYENEPKVFMDTDDHPSGIFIDLIKEIAADEGWTLVFVSGTWDEDLKALEEGRIDLMPDVAYTAERDKKYNFHKTPVAESWSHVYAAPGARIDRVSQLDGKRIAVLRGSIQETVFSQMTKGFGYDVKVVPVSSLPEAFQLASGGAVDAAIANHFFGEYFYLKYGLTRTPIVFNAVPLYYATAQGRNSDLLAAIDRHLDTWIKEPDSVYYRTFNRYTAKEPIGGLPRHVFLTVGTIGGLLIIAGGIILLLRWQVRAKTTQLRQKVTELEKAKVELLRAHEDLRRERERMEELAKSTIDAQERERQYLAAEIHDELLQSMIAVFYYIQALDTAQMDAKTRGQKDKLVKVLESSIRAGRNLIGEIRPISQPELGLIEAVQRSININFSDDTVAVDFQHPERLPGLDLARETNTLRIIQEALANVRKHSRAGSVEVSIAVDKQNLCIEVRDDGVGFSLESLRDGPLGHFGLLTMQERVSLVGAELSVESEPGKGTTVRCRIPLTHQ